MAGRHVPQLQMGENFKIARFERFVFLPHLRGEEINLRPVVFKITEGTEIPPRGTQPVFLFSEEKNESEKSSGNFPSL